MEEGEIQSILPGGALHVPQPVGQECLAGLQDTAEDEPSADEVVILEPGQEQAQKFIKAISNQSASAVLQLLRESGPLRLSDIAPRLGMSLNATKYHIENLMDVGLVEISNTRYSIKGRKVKMYRMKNQIFIVAPSMTEKKQIISAVLRYGSFLGLYLLVAVAFLVIIPLQAFEGLVGPLPGSLQTGGSAIETVALSGIVGDFIIALLLAGVVTIGGLVINNVIINWKRSGRSNN